MRSLLCGNQWKPKKDLPKARRVEKGLAFRFAFCSPHSPHSWPDLAKALIVIKVGSLNPIGILNVMYGAWHEGLLEDLGAVGRRPVPPAVAFALFPESSSSEAPPPRCAGRALFGQRELPSWNLASGIPALQSQTCPSSLRLRINTCLAQASVRFEIEGK